MGSEITGDARKILIFLKLETVPGRGSDQCVIWENGLVSLGKIKSSIKGKTKPCCSSA